MSDNDAPAVPVWTLCTSEATALVPVVADEGALTAERLTELRNALAAFSSAPLVTLEAHPLANLDFRCVHSTLFSGRRVRRAGSCS